MSEIDPDREPTANSSDGHGPEGDGPEADDPEGNESQELPRPEDVQGEDVEEMVQRAQEGDVDALNELFERYYGLLIEVARKRLGARLRQKEEADDLAQTTFREATRDFTRYQYRGEGSLLRWLIQILNNKIRDRAEFYSAGKRDMSRERTIDGEAEGGRRIEPPSEDLSVTRQVSREEEFGVLRKALEQLSPEHRTAITLVFFQGMTLREAGERMDGRTEDAVRMLLRRAEARLKDLVAGRLETPD
ncbi:RNA polymerase sigma factor [Engelhardtia mirabilis]|uniref:ECF RNA polymerase sigma factor SigD n=1 Tax=Engelhardtia mirabilis TaxID=2528011 RepID=A0A518BFF5_9BACT|nr:ECF RNA polymerase sigma factor SigD [Planctomycetes bacterium Pla133]QDV00040.1 ECF RNA polymerase sigma factor SigD [Planctomycetes bacterium Pla86]